jgi:hypothetical protein
VVVGDASIFDDGKAGIYVYSDGQWDYRKE